MPKLLETNKVRYRLGLGLGLVLVCSFCNGDVVGYFITQIKVPIMLV